MPLDHTAEPILEVRDVHAAYDQSRVLFGVSLKVHPGEVVALMGRNGVGKSTTFRAIMGLTPPSDGQVRFKGQDTTGTAPHLMNRAGLAWVPEDRRIFPELTVQENLDVASTRSKGGWSVSRVIGLFPDLEKLMQRRGGYLSGGQQQMLTIARALMNDPEVILLDEPSEGLAPLVVRDVFHQVQALRDEGLSVVLAEQNLDFVLDLADRVYILEKGQVKWSGTAAEVRADTDLQKRYLTV
ncbi:ABC transporter ATP-binding protein [Marivita sp. S0852]|uniref:ABC transporter ATP-binding protein n=1 Tax=Marivita sp. S0852 TaxID=3373893 RepID=UPI00398207F2